MDALSSCNVDTKPALRKNDNFVEQTFNGFDFLLDKCIENAAHLN